MIIECPSCTSRYRVREEKLPEAGGNIKCPNCAHVFFASRATASAAATSGAHEVVGGSALTSLTGDAAPPASMPPTSGVAPADASGAAAATDTASGGSKRWKLKNPVGLVYDFPETEQLRNWLGSRDSFEGIQVSSDAGKTWAPVEEVADLEGVRATGRKTTAMAALAAPGGAAPAPIPGAGAASPFASSPAQMREEAQARLREAQASRAAAKSEEAPAASFRLVRPPANRQQEQASKILLLMAVLILPLIAAIGMHYVGVIDLSDFGILPSKQTPVISTTPVVDPYATAAVEDDELELLPELTAEQAIAALMDQAASAQSRGEGAEAVDALERAASLAPADKSIQCLLEPLYESLGQTEEAAAAGERCRAPDEPEPEPEAKDEAAAE